MSSNRSSKARRASAPPVGAPGTTEAQPRSDPTASDVVTAQIDSTDEATGRPAQRKAIEQAMARQNVRLTRSPGAIGPIGRTVLLIALFALVGLVAIWVVLAL